MTRIIIAALVVLAVSGPALAKEVLYCVDTTHAVLDPGDKDTEAGSAAPFKFTVNILSPTRRLIDFRGTKYELGCEYNNFHRGTRCIHKDTNISAYVFYGVKYLRTMITRSETASYDNSLAFIAYGTCSKF